LLFLQNVDL